MFPKLQLILGLLVGLASPYLVDSHPGAVAEGRATCGSEYSTSDSAYIIPDIKEAWYLRRLATCQDPVFWTTFDIVDSNQQLYIAVISPELERFQDNIQFHAIVYGPGLVEDASNGLAAVPMTLPTEIDIAQGLGGAGYVRSPPSLASCDFVDTNPVMRQFSDVLGGRCMEEFTFEETYDDALQQGTISRSWWLYSFNHRAVNPGRYYIQSWLTTSDDDTNVASGKYEMTLGPWTWRGYASETTLELAQSQGSSCSCAVNALDYKEQYYERLGGLSHDFHLAQLPGRNCGASVPPSSCITIDQKPYHSESSPIEWSALIDVEVGRTYEWTFRAYWTGLNATFDYPDPGMFIFATMSNTTDSVIDLVDETLKEVVDDVPTNLVAEGRSLALDQPQFIVFTDPTVATSTTVLFQPTNSGSIALFTQHVPQEFMAHVLVDQESGDYIFPRSPTLYMDMNGADANDPQASTEQPAPEDDGTEVTADDVPTQNPAVTVVDEELDESLGIDADSIEAEDAADGVASRLSLASLLLGVGIFVCLAGML